MFATITFVRHGETEDNAKKLLSSDRDISLNEIGQKQAQLLGEKLEEIEFHQVFTSGKKRTRETALWILSKNKLSSIVEADIIDESDLIERSYGEWEGMTSVEGLKKLAELGVTDILAFTPPGGETLEQIDKRIFRFFNKIFDKIDSDEYVEKNLLIISHGTMIYWFLLEILKKTGLEYDICNFSKEQFKPKLDNTERSTFKVYKKVNGENTRKIEFIAAQDSSHLKFI